ARRVRCHGEDAPLPEQPAALAVGIAGERHAAELAPVDVWNAVMFRQALVEEGVIRRQQIDHAAVLAHDAFEKQLRLLPQRLPDVIVEVYIETEVRRDGLERAQVQPLAREIRDEASRPRIGEPAT